MELAQALETSGVAEVQVNSVVYTVKNDQAEWTMTEDGPSQSLEFTLSIQVGTMPVHETREYDTLDELLNDITEITQDPDLQWEPVEYDEGGFPV